MSEKNQFLITDRGKALHILSQYLWIKMKPVRVVLRHIEVVAKYYYMRTVFADERHEAVLQQVHKLSITHKFLALLQFREFDRKVNSILAFCFCIIACFALSARRRVVLELFVVDLDELEVIRVMLLEYVLFNKILFIHLRLVSLRLLLALIYIYVNDNNVFM